MELFDLSDDYSSEDYDEFIKLLAYNSEDMSDLKGGISALLLSSVPAPVAAPRPAVPAPEAAPRPAVPAPAAPAPAPAPAAREEARNIRPAREFSGTDYLRAPPPPVFRPADPPSGTRGAAHNASMAPATGASVVEPRKRQRAVTYDALANMRKRGAACSGKRVTQRDVMEGEVDADVLFSSAAKMYKGLQKSNKELVDELQELKDNFKLLGRDLARERALNKTMQEKLALYELRGEPPALVDLC